MPRARNTAVKIETRTLTLAKVALSLAFVALAASLIMVSMESGNKLESRAKGVFSGKSDCSCFQSQAEQCCTCTWADGSRGSACERL